MTLKAVVAIPAGLTTLTEYTPPSVGNRTGSRVSVEVAGGEVVLVFVMVIFLLASIAGVPSMYQVISVRGRLKSVMVTVKLS